MSTNSPVFPCEPVLANHVPAMVTGFTSWDSSDDLFSIFNSPVYQNPGLNNTIPSQIHNPGSDKDERRKKRKLSNRESAQRSRKKKQKYLEDARSQLNQLKIKNREMANRLRYVVYNCQREKMENDRLRLEHRVLQEKLLNVRQALVLRQIQQSSTCATWSCVNSTVVTAHQNPSMIRDHVI